MRNILEVRVRANQKYIGKKDEIKVRVPQGKKVEYQAAAASAGKSLNRYIIDLLESRIMSGFFLWKKK